METKNIEVKTLARAVMLVQTFKASLAAGVKHFDKAGRELKTIVEILTTLQLEGGVTLDTSGAENKEELERELNTLMAKAAT